MFIDTIQCGHVHICISILKKKKIITYHILAVGRGTSSSLLGATQRCLHLLHLLLQQLLLLGQLLVTVGQRVGV